MNTLILMISTIKPMLVDDLDQIRLLMKELGYDATPTELQERFRETANRPEHALFVAWTEEIRGFIHLEITHDLISEKKAHIRAMVVSEKSRGQGIGKELVQRAREWARINGVSIIYLSSNIMRDRAHAFYLREGFRTFKSSHFFELEI